LRARLSRGLRVGSTFPDFVLRDTGGAGHRLSDVKPGTLTVLWFTNFCADCRAQTPSLREAAAEARVLAVSILPAGDPLPLRLAPTLGFPLLLDPEDIVSRRLGLAHPPGACPMHNLFVVDAAGAILFKHHLSALGPEKFRAAWAGLTQRRRQK
jgi:peroxiredoxin